MPPIPIWILLALALGLVVAILPLMQVALVIIGMAAAVVILIDPFYGLVLTLIAGPFGALENVILGGSSFDSGQLLLALTIASWLANRVAERAKGFPWLFSIFKNDSIAHILVFTITSLGIFLFICSISILQAPSILNGVKETIKWIQMAIVALVAADIAKKKGGLRRLLLAIFLASLVQAIIGIWQFGFRGHGPEHFRILGQYYRAYGTYEQPNPYAGFLGLTLPIAVGIAMGEITWWMNSNNLARKMAAVSKQLTINKKHLFRLVTACLVVGVLGIALLLSWSRGGWLGATAGILMIVFLIPKKMGRGIFLLFGMLGLFLLLWASNMIPSALSDRITGFTAYTSFENPAGVDTTPENYAILERMAHWQSALNMANAKPWLGIGFGNYEEAYANYDLINWPYPLGHAHNYYLNLLAEVGILGLTAYLIFWAGLVWMTIRITRQAAYPYRGVALGLAASWTHLSVHHLVDKLYVNNIYLHMGVLFGILLLLLEKQSKKIQPKKD